MSSKSTTELCAYAFKLSVMAALVATFAALVAAAAWAPHATEQLSFVFHNSKEGVALAGEKK